ncbi:hypothetical protein [Coxiella burnetii]|uniref:Uncharacterized protein n=1 Tax=Coxiella burnetii (strain RSA 493 / Nine Mile phase I) TaxID=227377 RepID=Q83EE7_COXBU|nr:hypothetical protein [Coxiella burnetii]NP_819416.1 hypothetical protein CBU_0377 [Coxiella burnetii RSA 493]AAO89930.1 hypothetical protein CBU_0377 [Coxiella burnetii RSA 493]ABX78087.1 hypothetical protein COXBURSA331_A0486 [Coxiella burnetii RSA 331]AML48700.1 hypothetical protein AUR58_05555 [Coxiella burnetii]AML54672.1 hypothetical protein AYM38_04900 [Coxiella burnetii]ARI65261.1 hypothetical protein B7L74_01940 [Coxiella burnetii]
MHALSSIREDGPACVSSIIEKNLEQRLRAVNEELQKGMKDRYVTHAERRGSALYKKERRENLTEEPNYGLGLN